jgi:uncharacterized membrane protein YbhN (UPF0104 family)
MLRRLIHWSQPIFLIAAIGAIGWFLADQWPLLRTYPWRLDWRWLLLTLLLTLASWAVEIWIWRYLLSALGGKLPFLVATRLWFLSAIVRYIPGNVWQPLSLTLYNRRYGIAPEATLTSLVLFQIVTMLATAPILVVYFVWLDDKSLAAQFLANFPMAMIWLAIVPVLVFLLRPQWLVQILNWVLARLQRPPLAVRLTSGALLLLILVALFDWLLWGGVFASFTFAVTGSGMGASAPNPAMVVPLLVASYPLATVIGYLSFITPSGFGVREGAFYLLLTPHLAGGVVTVIALGLRVWSILAELIVAAISAPFERQSIAAITPAEPLLSETVIASEPLVAPEFPRKTM